MKVLSTHVDGILRLKFILDEDDKKRIDELNFGMDRGLEVFVDLGAEVDAIHPDLLGVISILIVNPFVGKVLILPEPVSLDFHKMASSVISRYKIQQNWDSDLKSLHASKRRNHALAFSGGADSVAALSVMPGSTIPIFLSRPNSEDSMYDSDAALVICKELSDLGYDVKIVDSNLEMIRNPVGFPTDLANAVPALLLSEALEISSISFGTVLESGYGIGHEKFVEYGKSAHFRFFGTLFSAVGVELSLPVIGISEVGTAIICENSPFGGYSQSCIRGTWLRPCMSCWKCFRKELLLFSLGYREEAGLISMLNSSEVQSKISSFPISHENVIVYSMQRIDLEEHQYLKPIVDKLDMSLDMQFLERWYFESSKFIPDSLRHKTIRRILQYLEIMGPMDESFVRGWDMSEHLKSKRAKKGQARLTSYWQDFSARFVT